MLGALYEEIRLGTYGNILQPRSGRGCGYMRYELIGPKTTEHRATA